MMADDNEFIDLRDELTRHIDREDYRYVKITLLNGVDYIITKKKDILILARVVFVFQHSAESCFLFDAICNFDVFRKRES